MHGSRCCTSPLTAVESGGKFISSAKNDASSEVPSSANTNAWAYKDGKLLMLKNSNSSRVAYYHLDDQVVFIRIIKSHGLSNVVSLVYEYASFQRKKGFIVFSPFLAIAKLKGKNQVSQITNLFLSIKTSKIQFVALSVLFQISIFVSFEFGILQMPLRSCVSRVPFFIQSINITLGSHHYCC